LRPLAPEASALSGLSYARASRPWFETGHDTMPGRALPSGRPEPQAVRRALHLRRPPRRDDHLHREQPRQLPGPLDENVDVAGAGRAAALRLACYAHHQVEAGFRLLVGLAGDLRPGAIGDDSVDHPLAGAREPAVHVDTVVVVHRRIAHDDSLL